MHNNYFFFRKLTPLIGSAFNGSVISECFSQNKDELLIRFETKEKPLFIKSVFAPSFSCLSFPEVFHRARKNSINLFEEIIGRRVVGIHQFNNERSFSIKLDDNQSLLFKMHGNRSNCILFEDDVPASLFNQSIDADYNLNLSSMERHIDWSFDAFIKNRDRLEAHYFTFGKVVWKYLTDRGFKQQSPEEQWSAIQEVLKILDAPTYYILRLDKIALSLLPFPAILKEFHEPVDAVNYFYTAYSHEEGFTSERNSTLSRLKSNLRSSENYYKKSSQRLHSLQGSNNYKIWADVIMANLHAIKEGSDRVTLLNFYDENKPVDIDLKPELTPQKNAEIYYSKAKKQQIEVSMLQEGLLKKERKIVELKKQLQELETIRDVKSLREFVSAAGIEEKSQPEERLPFHEVEFNGFRILVGKNAKSNDILTIKYGYKEDLWLHAKDVAGSHVLIKHQAGKKIGKDVIERAAQLAAYYSKRKNETLCPVAVTARKFVRKRKGDPPGMVIVEKEETILVEPRGIPGT